MILTAHSRSHMHPQLLTIPQNKYGVSVSSPHKSTLNRMDFSMSRVTNRRNNGMQSCPDGTFSNSTGSLECTPCPLGTTPAYPAASCKICPAGSYVKLDTPSSSSSIRSGYCTVSGL